MVDSRDWFGERVLVLALSEARIHSVQEFVASRSGPELSKSLTVVEFVHCRLSPWHSLYWPPPRFGPLRPERESRRGGQVRSGRSISRTTATVGEWKSKLPCP